MFHLEIQHGLQARHLKAINLGLHCINTLLVWQVMSTFNFPHANSENVATVAAALFAIHPVHTEAVCGVVGRADLMFGFLYLVSLLVVCKRKEWDGKTDIVVLILTMIGIFFKETAITIPLACIFVQYMRMGIFKKRFRLQMNFCCSSRNINHLVATAFILTFRLWLQGFESPEFKPLDNPVASHPDFLVRTFSQNLLYAINIWIMLCPHWLCFDWALGCVDLIKNIWDLRIQMILAMYAVLIIIVTNYRRNFGTILGLGLLVIPFLPASGIIKVGFVIAERVLYVPSIGFCVLIAYAFVYSRNRIEPQWMMTVYKWVLMLVMANLMLRTRERALDWMSEEKLFSTGLNVCPNNAKVHYNIARLATDKADQRKAFHHYHKAIELHPEYESALMNLGNLYRDVGDLDSAEKYIRASLIVLPEFSAAWMNLGIVQSARKQYDLALESYNTALKYRENYYTCHYNMGNLYLEMKEYTQAMHHWQQSVQQHPRQPKAWANILTLLDNQGLHEDAVRMAEMAMHHCPTDIGIMFIRANIYGKVNSYAQAEVLYKRCILAEPNNFLYYTNLGVLYHRWDKTEEAISSYKRAIQVGHEKALTAHENLGKLLKRLKKSNITDN